MITDMLKKNKSLFNKGMKIPKTAQDTIPFWEVYENGIFLVGEERYTLIFSFENLDYSLLRESEQQETYINYQKLLNALPTDIHYQEFIMNSSINEEQLRNAMIPSERRYGKLYDDYCSVLEQFITKSSQACANKIMLIALSYKPMTKVDNINVLFKYYRELQNYFTNLKVGTRQLMPEEVFKILHEYYHPFDNIEFLLPKNYFTRGSRLKDYIAPSMFAFKGKEKEVLASKEANSMLSNAKFKILLPQDPDNLQAISELFKLSPSQDAYLNTEDKGTGLIIAGSKVIPFDKRIKNSGAVYDIISTNFKDYQKMHGSDS